MTTRTAGLLLLLLCVPLAGAAEESNGRSVSAGATPEPIEAAPAEGSVEDAPPPVRLETSVTGYLDTRQTYQHVPGGRLLPASSVPAWLSITEGNFQLKLRWGDRGLAYVDASFFHQAGKFFQADTADGGLEPIDDRDVASLRPLTVVSEAYGTLNFGEHARLTVGKKRIVWGPGFALNPTDLLNPPKDPTDPTFQRAGSWLGWLEFPFDTFTLSFVGAAKTLRQYGGLPSALLVYPDHPTAEAVQNPALDDRDEQAHFSTVARAYFLWKDTDINLFWSFTNLYNDAFEMKNRAGFSLSRVVGEWELHFEAMGQLGSSRVYASPDCVTDVAAIGLCALSGRTIAARSRLEDKNFTARVLAGARWSLENNGLLSIEYSYIGDGYTADEFRDYVALVKYGQQAIAALPADRRPTIPGQQASDPGSPQKFTFDPLRRHYAFVTWQQPQVKDDFTLTATLLVGLEDLSGQLVPGVTWSAREWLNVSTALFVPIPGVPGLSADVGGKTYSEYGLSPVDVRAFVSARAFF